jgi:hypothetical protein
MRCLGKAEAMMSSSSARRDSKREVAQHVKVVALSIIIIIERLGGRPTLFGHVHFSGP